MMKGEMSMRLLLFHHRVKSHLKEAGRDAVGDIHFGQGIMIILAPLLKLMPHVRAKQLQVIRGMYRQEHQTKKKIPTTPHQP